MTGFHELKRKIFIIIIQQNIAGAGELGTLLHTGYQLHGKIAN